MGWSGGCDIGHFVCIFQISRDSPWETFIHRNVPLGHPLGNDFGHWQVGLSQWFFGSLNFYLQYSQTRKGEGGLYTPWDEPWMDNTVEEGYSEPFPTGVVEMADWVVVAWGCEDKVISD